jgi:polar amino acid transport system permease protein
MELFLSVNRALMEGFGETLKIFLLTLLIALPLGLVICFGSMSRLKLVRFPIRFLIWVIRGTPLMLQLILVFYGPGLLFGLPSIGRFRAVIVAFALNYACYFSEIYRGGIEAIPQGQKEAGQVLGLTRSQIFFKITLLQVIKRIMAPMSNECMTLVKDTALARVIAIYEVTWAGESFIKQGLIWPLFYTGIFYLLFCGILTLLFSYLERKLNYYRG